MSFLEINKQTKLPTAAWTRWICWDANLVEESSFVLEKIHHKREGKKEVLEYNKRHAYISKTKQSFDQNPGQQLPNLRA